jgi:hypothetical protein
LETPLKFRAPGITRPLGLGIGRMVFRALNLVEAGLATLLVVALLWAEADREPWLLLVMTLSVALVQVGFVRPHLDRRARLVISGHTPSPSRQHHAYVVMEVVKVGLLAALGATLSHGYLT